MQQNGLFFGVVFILLQIGRCALRDDDDSARASLEQARESAAKVATVRASPRSSLPAVNGDVDRELVVRASARIAALASDLGLSQLEQSVAGVERGFAEGCEALTPRFAELVAQSRDQDAELTTQVQYLWGEFLVACPDYAQAVRP